MEQLQEIEQDPFRVPLLLGEKNLLVCAHSVLNDLLTSKLRSEREVAPAMEEIGEHITAIDEAIMHGLPLPEGVYFIPADLEIDVRGRLDEIAGDEGHIYHEEAHQILYHDLKDLQPTQVPAAA